MGQREAVRRVVVHLQRGVFDHLRRQLAGAFKRHDLVVAAVDHQRRHVDFRHIRAEVGFAERGHAVDGALQGCQQGDVQRLGQGTGGNGLPGVDAVERRGEVADELGTIFTQSVANAVEHALIHTLREGVGFTEDRRDRAQQRQTGHARAAVVVDVAGYVAAAHGEAHQRYVAQVQGGDQVVNVGCKGVVVVAVPRLIRAAKAATVKGDGAEAALRQVVQLAIPHVAVQRPAVAEENRFARAAVFVVNLRAVFCLKRCHSVFLYR